MTTATASRTRSVDWIKKAQSLSTKPWHEEVLALDELHIMRIDAKGYQRLLDEGHIENIVNNFDASEARTIYVSRHEDGSHWVLDGQHTREGLMRSGIKEWICRVFLDLTLAEEARAFRQYQKNTRRIDPITSWNAEVLYGEPSTVAIEKILAQHRLRIGTMNLRVKAGATNVKCLNAFQKVYQFGEEDRPDGSIGRGGKVVLDETLMVLGKAFGTGVNTYQSRAINGLGFLLAKALPRPSMGDEPAIDLERLIAVLRERTTPGGIVDLMGKNVGGGSAPSRGAEVILEIYLVGDSKHPRIKSNSGPKMPARRKVREE